MYGFPNRGRLEEYYHYHNSDMPEEGTADSSVRYAPWRADYPEHHDTPTRLQAAAHNPRARRTLSFQFRQPPHDPTGSIIGIEDDRH